MPQGRPPAPDAPPRRQEAVSTSRRGSLQVPSKPATPQNEGHTTPTAQRHTPPLPPPPPRPPQSQRTGKSQGTTRTNSPPPPPRAATSESRHQDPAASNTGAQTPQWPPPPPAQQQPQQQRPLSSSAATTSTAVDRSSIAPVHETVPRYEPSPDRRDTDPIDESGSSRVRERPAYEPDSPDRPPRLQRVPSGNQATVSSMQRQQREQQQRAEPPRQSSPTKASKPAEREEDPSRSSTRSPLRQPSLASTAPPSSQRHDERSRSTTQQQDVATNQPRSTERSQPRSAQKASASSQPRHTPSTVDRYQSPSVEEEWTHVAPPLEDDPLLSLQAEVMLMRKTVADRRRVVDRLKDENESLRARCDQPVEIPTPSTAQKKELELLDVAIRRAKSEEKQLKERLSRLQQVRDVDLHYRQLMEAVCNVAEEVEGCAEDGRCIERRLKETVVTIDNILSEGTTQAHKLEAAFIRADELAENTVDVHRACIASLQEIQSQRQQVKARKHSARRVEGDPSRSKRFVSNAVVVAKGGEPHNSTNKRRPSDVIFSPTKAEAAPTTESF